MNLLFSETVIASPDETILKVVTIAACLAVFVLLLMKQKTNSAK